MRYLFKRDSFGAGFGMFDDKGKYVAMICADTVSFSDSDRMWVFSRGNTAVFSIPQSYVSEVIY